MPSKTQLLIFCLITFDIFLFMLQFKLLSQRWSVRELRGVFYHRLRWSFQLSEDIPLEDYIVHLSYDFS